MVYTIKSGSCACTFSQLPHICASLPSCDSLDLSQLINYKKRSNEVRISWWFFFVIVKVKERVAWIILTFYLGSKPCAALTAISPSFSSECIFSLSIAIEIPLIFDVTLAILYHSSNIVMREYYLGQMLVKGSNHSRQYIQWRDIDNVSSFRLRSIDTPMTYEVFLL